VLRLKGSGLCDLKPHQYFAIHQIECYFEPNRVLETLTPSLSDLKVATLVEKARDGPL